MKKLWLAAIAVAVFSVSPTGAQTAIPLMTVDEVGIESGGSLLVTGVVQGESTPTTRTIYFMYSPSQTTAEARFTACHRSLLLAMSKPGQYLVRAGPNSCVLVLAAP